MPKDPQVEPEHYGWGTYVTKGRWVSFWHQIDEVLAAKPASCLEIGSGAGVIASILRDHDVPVTVVDIDPRLGVDRVGSVTELPCTDSEFDVTLCAQVLEHLPWDSFPQALREIKRVTAKRAVISLPQKGRTFRLLIELPLRSKQPFQWLLKLPGKVHSFDGQHYWEVGALGTGRRRVRRELAKQFLINSEYTVPENAYHRFYVVTPKPNQ